ncbi:beta-alanine-activating enzyme [Megalops cyprinoides]|uniref:beta-alanine-activating enzyme n=1 Tax=Megalops cyprinoides TaxID=118141 RepID=UPI0018653766|nr:beta-alanine-activating enzyme [Megalops cyprinoides]
MRTEMCGTTLHEMVQKAAVHHSNRIAVTFDSCAAVGCVSRTYSELLSAAEELTRLLRIRDRRQERLFGLYCQPGINLPHWILGILQVPAAYVPLDPDAPPLLSVRVMEQSKLTFAVVQSHLTQNFLSSFTPHLPLEVCEVWQTQDLTLVKILHESDTDSQEAAGEEEHGQGEQPPSEPCSLPAEMGIGRQGALAYVLHTSGTTGVPKTVRVPHQCIVPNILHLRSLFQVTADDVIFMASPLTFDPSVVEMFLALSSGACLLMVPTVIKKVPSRLATVLFTHHKTTVLQATPTVLQRFGGRVLRTTVLCASSSLRVLALGGEVCPSVPVLLSWREEGNSTRIFNLYGTTEVSCWATCYQLQLEAGNDVSVPLGTPLMGTVVEVRDEGGGVVTHGSGQVFIGGHERVCILGDEVTVAPGAMRSTGDWVEVRGSHLYYLGRRDRLVKRHGQQLHLDALQQTLECLPQVEACAVSLYEGQRLLAFVVPAPSTRDLQRDPNSSDPAPSYSDIAHPPRSLQTEILGRLSQLLPSHSIPDTILLVLALPLSSHGKVAMDELIQVYKRWRARHVSHDALGDKDALRQHLQMLWKEALALDGSAEVDEEAHFLLSGGDSLRSLHLCDDITASLGVTLPGILEVILNGSFSDLLNHVAMATFQKENTDNTANIPLTDALPQPRAKRKHTDPPPQTQAKRKHTDPPPQMQAKRNPPDHLSSESVQRRMGFVVVRRAGEVVEMGQESAKELLNHRNANQRTESNANKDHSNSTGANESMGDGAAGSSRLALRVRWQSDTGRCVDASPLLLLSRWGQDMVYVGSHSHRLQALELTTGRLRWERVLGGRMESSAAVTRCGALIVIGCYDGQVYFLSADSGETHWVFGTDDAVKSSATVDPLTGLVLLGSHDAHVYALDPEGRHCVWKRQCGGGAVFSSPCLHQSLRQLYVATLGGQLLSLRPVRKKLPTTL